MTAWALAAPATGAQPASAELPAPAPAPAQDAHTALYDTLQQLFDKEQSIDNLVKATTELLAERDPTLQAAEQLYPGVINAIGEGLRPIFREYSERVHREYRPKMIEAMRTTLTADEAVALTQVYTSPAGRKLLQGLAAHDNGKETLSQALDGGKVDEAAVGKDLKATSGGAVKGLTDAERQEIALMMLRNPSLFVKAGQMSKAMLPIRVEMENTPLTPDEDARLQQAVITAIENVVATQDAKDRKNKKPSTVTGPLSG